MLEEDRKRRQFEEQKQKLRLLSSVKPKASLSDMSWLPDMFTVHLSRSLGEILILYCAVLRQGRRAVMMPWKQSRATWMASAETQRCIPLHLHRPRSQVLSPEHFADVIPVFFPLLCFSIGRSVAPSLGLRLSLITGFAAGLHDSCPAGSHTNRIWDFLVWVHNRLPSHIFPHVIFFFFFTVFHVFCTCFSIVMISF